jgi:hypothetical protein
VEASLIFNPLPSTVADMHLYFASYLQARRDARLAGRYVPSIGIRGPSSPSDRE